MFFFTHLYLAKVLYRHFSGEVELDKMAFAYGNIKPDLPSRKRVHHTLENCIFTVSDYSDRLINEETSVEEFSICLGEICHYISDFFCYYHLNEEIHNKKISHLIYELRIHQELWRIRFKQKIKVIPSKMLPRKEIYSIILEMRKVYFSRPQCIKRDIEYALSTAVWACESILYYIKYSSDFLPEVEQELYTLLIAEGGRL